MDGLHDAAGSGRVLKLHGDIWRMRCTVCGANWPDRRAHVPKLPPHCACGGVARPGVVWFGEPLPEGMMEEAASLIPHALGSSARVIEINTEETEVSARVDCALRGPGPDSILRGRP